MSPRRHAATLALSLLIVALSLVFISDALFWRARLDVTADQRFTLTAPARTVAAELAEPVEVSFVFSARAAADRPELQAHARFVRETLSAFEAASRGKVRVTTLDPSTDAALEKEARAWGLKPLAEGRGAPIFLGISAANAVNERAAISGLDPKDAGAVQKAVAELLARLERPQAPFRAPAIALSAREIKDASLDEKRHLLLLHALLAPALLAILGFFVSGRRLKPLSPRREPQP